MSFLLERHDSLIHRLSGSSLNETSLSTTQRSVDQMVGGFLNQATRVETLVPMILGGFTYRLAHAGLMSATQSFGCAAQTLLSSSLALGAEVTVFEESGRLFHPQHSPRRLQQWGASYLNFGALKMGGHLALGQNLIVSHLIQDSSMVLANQVVGRLGLTPLPQENLFQQFLEAESMNLHMALGMGLAHRFLGSSFMAFERSLSLVSHRASLASSLSFESIRSDSSSFTPRPRWALRAALASLVGIFTFATPHVAEAATRIRSEGSENIGLYLLGLGLSGVALGMAISRRQTMTLTEFPRVNDLLVRAQLLYAADSYQEYQAWRVEARDLCQAMNEVEREKLLEVLKESLTNGLPPARGGGLYVLSLLYPHLPVERRAEFFRYVVDNMHDETPAVVQITSIVLSEIYKNLSARDQLGMALNLSTFLSIQSRPTRKEVIQAWMRLIQSFGESEQRWFMTNLSSSFQATDHPFWNQLLKVVKNPARVELFKQVTQRLVDLGGIQNTADIALLDLMRPHLNRLETVQDAEIHDWIACLRMQHHPELKRVGDEVYFHLFPSERKSSKGRGGGSGLNTVLLMMGSGAATLLHSEFADAALHASTTSGQSSFMNIAGTVAVAGVFSFLARHVRDYFSRPVQPQTPPLSLPEMTDSSTKGPYRETEFGTPGPFNPQTFASDLRRFSEPVIQATLTNRHKSVLLEPLFWGRMNVHEDGSVSEARFSSTNEVVVESASWNSKAVLQIECVLSPDGLLLSYRVKEEFRPAETLIRQLDDFFHQASLREARQQYFSVHPYVMDRFYRRPLGELILKIDQYLEDFVKRGAEPFRGNYYLSEERQIPIEISFEWRPSEVSGLDQLGMRWKVLEEGVVIPSELELFMNHIRLRVMKSQRVSPTFNRRA